MGFCQTFVVGAYWDKDELIGFWGQKVKAQGHIITQSAVTGNSSRNKKEQKYNRKIT